MGLTYSSCYRQAWEEEEEEEGVQVERQQQLTAAGLHPALPVACRPPDNQHVRSDPNKIRRPQLSASLGLARFFIRTIFGRPHCCSPDKMYRQDKVKYKPRDSN